jgi:hypothetical protein
VPAARRLFGEWSMGWVWIQESAQGRTASFLRVFIGTSLAAWFVYIFSACYP